MDAVADDALDLALSNARATRTLGERLGRVLEAGDVVALIGDLGAGKTTFTQGLARGLGVPTQARVRSPTFAIAHVYEGGRAPLYHVDVYRLDSEAALWALGFEDYVSGDGVCVVEWADRMLGALPADRLEVRLRVEGAARAAIVHATGPKARERLRALTTPPRRRARPTGPANA